VKFQADWQLIKELKQKQININNQRENKKSSPMQSWRQNIVSNLT